MMRRLFILVIALTAGYAAMSAVPKPLPEWSRAEFIDEVHTGRIRTVVIEDRQVITGESSTRGPFRTRFNQRDDAGLPDELRRLGVEVRFERFPLGLI